MSKIKVGDRVMRLRGIYMDMKPKDTDVVIEIIDNNLATLEKFGYGHDINNLVKIGDNISKYDELKNRIKTLHDGWNKEADDIREEICKDTSWGVRVEHYNTHTGYFSIFDTMETNIQADSYERAFKRFQFDSQCEKMKAFKQALLWLLDHSDIKKDIVGTEQKVEIEGKVYKARIIEEA